MDYNIPSVYTNLLYKIIDYVDESRGVIRKINWNALQSFTTSNLINDIKRILSDI